MPADCAGLDRDLVRLSAVAAVDLDERSVLHPSAVSAAVTQRARSAMRGNRSSRTVATRAIAQLRASQSPPRTSACTSVNAAQNSSSAMRSSSGMSGISTSRARSSRSALSGLLDPVEDHGAANVEQDLFGVGIELTLAQPTAGRQPAQGVTEPGAILDTLSYATTQELLELTIRSSMSWGATRSGEAFGSTSARNTRPSVDLALPCCRARPGRGRATRGAAPRAARRRRASTPRHPPR